MPVFLLLFLCTITCFGQTTKPLRFNTEIGSYFSSSGLNPFWLRANQYGIVPHDPTILTWRQALHVDYHDAPKTKRDSLQARNRRVDWGWRAEGVVNTGNNVALLIPEAYAKVRLGSVEIWGGRRREIIGLVDSSLTSGSYIMSGNALPMLKLQVAVQEYTPRRSLFAFKGFYSHGWFERDRFVQNTMLHQKALYVRVGKPNWRLKLYGGMNHQVMWGGTTTQLPGTRIKNNLLPSRFSDYLDVVSASSLNNRANVDTNRISQFDRENRIGNHLGTIDLGFDYTGRNFSLFVYRQNIYEDGSLIHLANIRDGLNGIRIRNLRPYNPRRIRLDAILIEYLYTQNQGGSVFSDLLRQHGRDNYFNHSQYQDGWSRYGMTIGTPFITPSNDTRTDLPRYGFTNNNRVAVMHLGLSGQVMTICRFQLKASYSENLGTYEVPFPSPVYQFSGVANLAVPLPVLNGLLVNASIATDIGDLYPNSTGFYLGLRKDGQTKKR